MEVEKTKNTSLVYFIVVIILLVVAVGGIYFASKKFEGASIEENAESPASLTKVVVHAPSLKGQKLSDTRFAANAVQIYPGIISESAKSTMSGWDLKTVSNSDGTITASLVPTGSEITEGDSSHTYTLHSGDKLYFVDMNPGDDVANSTDNNKNDDMGIVVNSDGLIQ